jgi:hypothetical protein
MTRPLLFILVIFTLSSTGISATHVTSTFGFWNDASTWVGGVIPSAISSDTFLINHPIAIEQSITLEPNAYMRIDSAGGICGHHKLTATNALIDMYGILELDTLQLISSQVYCNAPGYITLTLFGQLSGTGALLTTSGGGSIAVGPWFDCSLPAYNFTLDIEEKMLLDVDIYPNPTSDFITIKTPQLVGPMSISIFDLTGKTCFELIQNEGTTQEIDIRHLKTGIYQIRILNDGKTGNSKLLKL